MKQLIPQSKIDEAAIEASTINKDNYPAWEILFKQGVQFALNEIQQMIVEFGNFTSNYICYWVKGENMWLSKSDYTIFYTTQQLLEEFINYRTMKELEKLLEFESDEERQEFIKTKQHDK